MKKRITRAAVTAVAVTAALQVLSGCSVFQRDSTGTPENQKLTLERQKKLADHRAGDTAQ